MMMILLMLVSGIFRSHIILDNLEERRNIGQGISEAVEGKEKEKEKVRQNEQKDRNRKVVSEDSVDEAETSKKGRQLSGSKTRKFIPKSSSSKSQK